MTHLIISNLGEYAAVFNTAYLGGKMFINMILGYLIFLKNRHFACIEIPSLIHEFTGLSY